CIIPLHACGEEVTGSCERGFSCDGTAGPACLCNGEVLEDIEAQCKLWTTGQARADPEVCAVGTFACGDLECRRNVEICVAVVGGTPESGTTYRCAPVAEHRGRCEHGIADCLCLDLQSLGCGGGQPCCSADEDHQETVRIALP
ncbi:hypothetical protein BE04_09650, partial [Sorangium cellulosum]